MTTKAAADPHCIAWIKATAQLFDEEGPASTVQHCRLRYESIGPLDGAIRLDRRMTFDPLRSCNGAFVRFFVRGAHVLDFDVGDMRHGNSAHINPTRTGP
jgi:hypothetical protein